MLILYSDPHSPLESDVVSGSPPYGPDLDLNGTHTMTDPEKPTQAANPKPAAPTGGHY